MHGPFESEIREVLTSGDKIAAIKRYREETGVGLAEAKEAVESLEAVGSFLPSFSSSTLLPWTIRSPCLT